MKTLVLLVTLVGLSTLSTQALSGPASDSLGVCLTDSLSGKERKQLARWIFFAMAAHPEMERFATITDADRDDADRVVGRLFTRLLAEDCAQEARLAVNEEGPVALQGAFELVGRVAMQELMTNQDVATSISNYGRYLDQEKLNSITATE